MKVLDITFDLETCALCPNTAVMSVGALAWQRDGKVHPFLENIVGKISQSRFCFLQHVDLRSSFLDGFTFDQETADWWSRQNSAARASVLAQDSTPLLSIDEVVNNLFAWMTGLKKDLDISELYLWSQGSDFDIAILRNICYKYRIDIPVHYHNFRDHRTFFMEGARLICDVAGTNFDPKKAYGLVESYDDVESGSTHDPIYDCKRSIFATWQMMNYLRCLNIQKNR